MKKINIAYWIITLLFAAFMIFSAVPDLMLNKEAQVFMSALGYPDYFTRFIGFAKILGSIAIVIPGFPRIKEWAYAGLIFDLIGAMYSMMSVYGVKPEGFIMLVFIGWGFASYALYHKRQSMLNAAHV